MPYTRKELLTAVRTDHPEFKDVDDDRLFAALSTDHPEMVKGISDISPSLLASRQAASASEFEKNLPQEQTAQGLRANPVSSILKAPLYFMTGAEEAMGLDPMHPMTSLFTKAIPAAATGFAKLAGVEGPRGQVDAIKGIPAGIAAGVHRGAEGIRTQNLPEMMEGAGGGYAMSKPLVEAGAAVAKRIPPMAETRNALADAAERKAAQMGARVMAPVVGPNKVRLGNVAADIAPEVMAQTKGLSKTGLRASIQNNLQLAMDGLDEAHDSISPNTMYDTEPLIETLEKKRAALDVKGAANDAITPENRASQAMALDKTIEEAKRLGPSANFENLRKLRGAWDDGAKEIYTPSVTADYLKAQGRGVGYSRAAGSLRDFLADVEPGTPEANAKYHLWRQADDVMQAAEETERVRPTGLKTAGGRIAGAAMAKGGILGKLTGAAVGPAIEWALTGASTAKQIWVSRQLARLAENLRIGNGPGSDAILASIHDRIDLEGGLPPGIPGKGPVISPVKGGGTGPTNPPPPLVSTSGGKAVVGKRSSNAGELLSPQPQGVATGYGSYFKPEKPLPADAPAMPSVSAFYQDLDSLRSPKTHLNPGATKADLASYADKLRSVAETNQASAAILTIVKRAEDALKSGDRAAFVKEAEDARLALRKEYGERLAASEAKKHGL